MFDEINTQKTIFMLEMEVQNINGLRILIAAGGVSEDALESDLDDIPNAELRKIMKGSKPITVSSDNAHYEISFINFISYAVTFPSYTVADDGKFDGVRAGTYTDSAFLRYVGDATYADKNFPGPFEHYCVWCFNQKIDVVSTHPPVVRQIDVGGNSERA